MISAYQNLCSLFFVLKSFISFQICRVVIQMSILLSDYSHHKLYEKEYPCLFRDLSALAVLKNQGGKIFVICIFVLTYNVKPWA